MTNELILRDADILNPAFSFDDKMVVASEVATSLRNVIDTQNLAVSIQGNKYVTAEGWGVLGTMLGCSPYVVEVTALPTESKRDIIYKAVVEIRQGSTVLSRAEAIAERNNRQRDRFAIYSMAQTRALGKAYRMCLSWIVKLAGYEPTPAEEMPKFTAKDMQQKKQVNETVVKEDGSTYEVVDMTNQPTRKQQTNINEMVVEDPEPLRSLMNQFIRELEKEGKEINKSNIRVKASQYKRETEMPPLNFKDLIEFINENCPEELD